MTSSALFPYECKSIKTMYFIEVLLRDFQPLKSVDVIVIIGSDEHGSPRDLIDHRDAAGRRNDIDQESSGRNLARNSCTRTGI